MAATRPLNIICFATFFKGGDFMRECHARGSNVILITKEKMLEEDWPRDVLADLFALPNDAPVELFIDLRRTHLIDVVACDSFVELALASGPVGKQRDFVLRRKAAFVE